MSCYIVTAETMSRVADIVELAYKSKHYDKNAMVAIFDRLNRQAYAERYKEDEAEIEPEIAYIPSTEAVDLATLLLAGDKWLYQCDNGTVPDDIWYTYVETAVKRLYKERAEYISGKHRYEMTIHEARKIVQDHDQPTFRWH